LENRRRNNRTKAVLPVRVCGSDGGGSYTDLAHTLDITETGIRLGFIRRSMSVGSRVMIQYRQHKAEFRVVWVSQLSRLKEHHVGLEALVPRDFWGLAADLRSRVTPPSSQPPNQASV